MADEENKETKDASAEASPAISPELEAQNEATMNMMRNLQTEKEEADSKSPRPVRSGGKPFYKKRVCRFCFRKEKIDYKNADELRRFTTERGKILPRRVTGVCAKHQRELADAIKRARAICLLPYVAD